MRVTCLDPHPVPGQARGLRLIHLLLRHSRNDLRNAAVGHRTTIEAATEFLRNQVLARRARHRIRLHHLVGDLHRETGEIERAGRSVEPGDVSRAEGPGWPTSTRRPVMKW